MCTEAEARHVIGSEGASVLVEIVEGAWTAYLDERRPRHSRTRANVVWDYMVMQADEKLLPWESVRRVELGSDTPGYVLGEQLMIRFKKIAPGLKTSNVATKAQRTLAETGAFEGMPDIPTVSCGYVLDAAESEVKDVVLVRWNQNEFQWFVDLRELASGVLEPAQPLLPGISEPTLPGLPVIRRRKTDGSEYQ